MPVHERLIVHVRGSGRHLWFVETGGGERKGGGVLMLCMPQQLHH